MSDYSSRDSSPDPITLPSSPLSGRKLLRGSSRKPRLSTPRRASPSRASPTKSIVLDTPQGGDGQSPWRIKVTVQAEPRDGSPGKMITRTRSIPLMSPSTRRSNSPGKKSKGKMAEGEVKKPSRKRKGTPIREKRSAPQLRRQQSQPEPELELELEPQPTVEEVEDQKDDDLPLMSQTPPDNRRSSGRMARLTAQWSDGTGKTKRLSTAREELDQALMDAVGGGYAEPGDMTLSRAEDFTMVSMESLQTAKEASMLHNSQLHAIPEGHKSTLSVSYLPSSPPKTQQHAQSLYPDIAASVSRSSFAPNASLPPALQARTAQTSLQSPFEPVSSAKKRASLRQDYDAMSWQPTGPAKGLRLSQMASEKSPAQVQIPRSEWQEERQAVSQQIQSASSQDVVVVDDDAQSNGDSADGLDNGDDLWDNETSRSLEDRQAARDSDQQHHAYDSSSGSEIVVKNPQSAAQRSTGRIEAGAEDEHLQQVPRSERVEDLFSHIPLKPARSKIPRTWRRSSGMDFSYVDSPARPPVPEEAEEHRHSENGSGVLTPPSSHEEDELDDDHDEAGTVDLQGEADEQLQSEFTIPEAEATRFHDEDMIDDEDEIEQDSSSKPAGRGQDAPVRIDSKSPVYDSGSGDDDTGEFLQNNLPQVFLKDKPRRRPPRRETTDLADLLDLDGSPAKPVQNASSRDNARIQTKTSQDIRSSRDTQNSMHGHGIKSPISLQPSSDSQQKPLNSPLRKSLLSSSKVPGNAPSVDAQDRAATKTNDLFRQRMLRNKAAAATSDSFHAARQDQDRPQQYTAHIAPEQSSSLLTHDPLTGEPLAQPKRRGRQRRVQQLTDHSQTESTMTDSFASKASDQRQLLQEAATSRLEQQPPERPTTGIGFRDYADGQPQKQPLETETPGQRQQEVEASNTMRDTSYEETDETMARNVSYQENLNLDSPTKIKVKFNDTMSGNSSWLDQPKRYPPLFSQNAEQPRTPTNQLFRQSALQRPQSPREKTLVDKERSSSTTGLLSRLTTTFWNAVIRPTGPAEVMPPPEAPITFPVTLRSQIRSRYGVLCESYPWTMSHMRTLHRMLNSLTSGRYDSIIPRKGPLPKELSRKINTTQRSITDHAFLFKPEFAYVVWSFMQILVPAQTIQMMSRGEIEFIGDATAKRIRGYFDPKRHGDDPVWTREALQQKDPAIAAWVQTRRGAIEMEFVSKALGDCVLANEVLRERLEREGRGEEFERVCFGDLRATPEREVGEDEDGSLDQC